MPATLVSFSCASLVSVAASKSKKTLTLRSCSSALSRSAWPWAWKASAGVAGLAASTALVSSCLGGVCSAASGLGAAWVQAARPAATAMEKR